jgi:hypothetical protein
MSCTVPTIRTGVPRGIANKLPDLPDDPDRAVRPDHPEVAGEWTPAFDRDALDVLDLSQVIWVNEVDERRVGLLEQAGRHAVDAVRLVGPPRDAGCEVPLPAPDVRDALRLGHVPAPTLAMTAESSSTAALVSDAARACSAVYPP